MKLTLTNIKKMKANSTPLQKRVIDYIVDEWSEYDDKKHIFTDVLYHGCQTGVVGFLIWYSDTVRFYKQYKEEIDELLYDLMNETGIYSLPELFGDKWDKGMFEKIWQFSADLIKRGMKILEVSSDEQFIDVNIDKLTEEEPDKFILRAHADGKPEYLEKNIGGTTYKAVKVGEKIYIPNN